MTLSLTIVTWAPVDASGQPVQDVSVIFTPAADATVSGTFVSGEPYTARPGGDGTFTVELVPGAYTVAITAGQQETRYTITVPVSMSPVDLDTLLPAILL